jgi:hypothetical protein
VPLVLGLSWLVLNARKSDRALPPRRKTKSLIASQKKENHHEDSQKAKAGQSRP